MEAAITNGGTVRAGDRRSPSGRISAVRLIRSLGGRGWCHGRTTGLTFSPVASMELATTNGGTVRAGGRHSPSGSTLEASSAAMQLLFRGHMIALTSSVADSMDISIISGGTGIPGG